MQRTPTVVVIGLGAVGAMAAWHLSRRDGVRVIGIEQYGRVHHRGSYAGESRVFRTAYHEGSRYVPMLLESRRLWQQLEEESGREVFLDVGCLSIAPADHPEFQTTLGSVQDFDLPHRLFNTDELRAAYPQHKVADGDVGILDELGGGIRPEVSIMSALDLAEERGAELRFHTRVLGIDEDAGGVSIRTQQGTIRADRVVIATGSWSRRLVPDLDRLLRLQPLGLTWFMVKDPSLYAADRFPTFLRDHGTTHFFGVPTLDGYSIKASGNPRWGVCRDVDEVPVAYSPDELNELGQHAAELFAGINPEPVRSSIHHCAYTPNRLPVVDTNASERIVIVTGLSGHGFKFAPSLGVIAAKLALGDSDSELDPDFRLDAHLADLELHGPYRGGGH